MSVTPCKALRKDGSPCRGHALDKYNGLCIAHGPTPEQAREWRALGGRNSAAAQHLDVNPNLDVLEAASLRNTSNLLPITCIL